MRDTWDNYLPSPSRNSQFELTCTPKLLDRFVQSSIQSVETQLPEAKRNEHPLPIETDMMQIPSDATVEILLNQSSQILIGKPELYADWEQKAVEALGFPFPGYLLTPFLRAYNWYRFRGSGHY